MEIPRVPRIPGYLLLEVVAWAAWVPTAPAQGRAGTPEARWAYCQVANLAAGGLGFFQ